jgi:diguanylate cyclase
LEQTGQLVAAGDADAGADTSGLGHPGLAWFDDIRALFARTGLPPEPEIYEILYLYVSGADAALSREVVRILTEGAVTTDMVKAIRRAHVGEIAASELLELVEAAQDSALALAERLDRGLADVRSYDDAIAEEDAALAVARSAHELAELVQRLRRANATVMAANRRLEADIKTASLETGKLLDRLDAADKTARTDPLTGLLNRRGLLEALKKAQAAALQAGTALSTALVDIDHFKRVNDQWGHAIGDEVLRCVATHLASHARRTAGEGAFAGRHGGEEFVVALPGLGVREAAAAIDNARAILARQVLRRSDDGASLGRISFSAGVSGLREDDCADSLIDRADAALYAAKRAGRDRVLPELPKR